MGIMVYSLFWEGFVSPTVGTPNFRKVKFCDRQLGLNIPCVLRNGVNPTKQACDAVLTINPINLKS